jgi:hypothetical protein
LNNPYEKYSFHFNSSRNKRGVGILIKISWQTDILESVLNPDENFLLLRVRLRGKEVVLGSIYGPNSNDPQFFENLKTALARFNDIPIICGGDWNCTFSSSPLLENIDCHKMSRLPNLMHSRLVNEMCNELNLMDPYRFLYPGSKEFAMSQELRMLQINLELISS